MDSPTRGEQWVFWLGVASLTCFGPLTGVLAVVVGFVVLRQKQHKSSLALAGIIAGAFGTAAGVIALGVGFDLLQWRADRHAVTAAGSPTFEAPPPLPDALPPGHPALPPGHPPIGAEPSEPATATATSQLGTITLVEVGDGEKRSLRAVLRAARHEGDPLLVYVRAPRCAPCKRFESTLQSARMQTALSRVVLVAVDANEYDSELEALRIDTHDVPAFARLAFLPEPYAEDAMTGIEWDDDTPENIAPVFSRFLAGTMQKRRQAPPFVGTSL